MRIAIDLQGAQTESRFRGIGRYSLSFAQAIVRNRGEHEVIIVLSGMFPETIEPIRAAFHGLLPQENIKVWTAVTPVRGLDYGNEGRRKVAELVREAYLESLAPDIIHITSVFEGYIDDAVTSIGLFDEHTPVTASMYDLIPMLNADRYLKPSKAYSDYYLQKLETVKQAACLMAISESSRQEVIAHLGLDASSVENISAAASKIFKPAFIETAAANELLEKYGIQRKFLLYSGGGDERKNLLNLLRAFALLPECLRHQYRLVLAGKIPPAETAALRSEQARLNLGPDEVNFTGYISDDDLADLYRLCTLFVFPSLHEGFGLPVLEAMACGAAVIGSSVTSIPEVIGRNDALFDPYDIVDIKERIVQVLENDAFRLELAAHGPAQAEKFSWDITATGAISIFERLMSSREQRVKKNEGPDDIVDRLISRIGSLDLPSFDDQALLWLASSIARIVPRGRPQHLFVDVSELAKRDAKSGVQRVTRTILNELLDHPPKGYVVKPVVSTVDRSGYFHANDFMSRLRGTEVGGPSDDRIEYHPGDIFLGLDLQHSTTLAQQRYLSAMRNEGVKVFFVVYDLLPVLFPQFWPAEHSIDRLHHKWLKVLSHFDGAICISSSVADELKEWLTEHAPDRLRPFEIGWFHLGADVQNSLPTTGLPDDADSVIEQLAARTSFLAVGTIEPRKAHTQILDAFEVLWAEGLDINAVFVGKKGWMVDELTHRMRNHKQYGKRLFWFEGVSDEYLNQIYKNIHCLIAASYGEGFGLPLIEAAQHGVPLLARDIPVFREVARNHAYYFAGNDAGDLASAIRAWIGLYQLNEHPSSAGMPWQTWRQSAEQLKLELDRLSSLA